MNHVDLFSGTGAFSLAAENVGFETVAFSEIDPFCCALLKHHWPHVKNYGDIRNVPAIKCSLLTGGFPCQPFSIAGKRKGTNDDRYLWPSMLAVIERCEPDWIIGENVVNIKNMVLSRCLDDLAQRGYQSKAFDIPSCAVGLPSVERHVWIVASCLRTGLSPRNGSEVVERQQAQTFLNGQSIVGGPKKQFTRHDDAQSPLLGTRKGIPNFLDRTHAIGNSVPPPIAQIFCQAIFEMLKKQLTSVPI